MHRLISIVGVALVTLCSGCTTWTRKGDVLVSDGKAHGWFLVARPAYSLKFPRVKIGVTGSTTVRVRDLPAPVFPEYADIEVPTGEDYGWTKGQPWRAAVIQFTFRTKDGVVLNSKKVALEDWEGGSEPSESSSTRNVYFRISPWTYPALFGFDLPPPPNLSSYDLIIDVLMPSRRPNDSLTLKAWFPLPTRPEANHTAEVTQR